MPLLPLHTRKHAKHRNSLVYTSPTYPCYARNRKNINPHCCIKCTIVMTRMLSTRQGGNPGPRGQQRRSPQKRERAPLTAENKKQRGEKKDAQKQQFPAVCIPGIPSPPPSPLKKRLSSGMRSSLKDDGGWGPSPPKRRGNGQEGNTPSERPKPLHPILLCQGVWALGPTGVEEKKGGSEEGGRAVETDPPPGSSDLRFCFLPGPEQ